MARPNALPRSACREVEYLVEAMEFSVEKWNASFEAGET